MNIRRLELMGRENVTRAQHKMNTVLDNHSVFQQILFTFSRNRILSGSFRAASE